MLILGLATLGVRALLLSYLAVVNSIGVEEALTGMGLLLVGTKSFLLAHVVWSHPQ